MPFYEFEGLVPVVHPTAYVHPTAVLIGDVFIGADVYIGPCASLRGDYGRLIVNQGANVQDGCIMHGYCDVDTIVEENVSVGHGAVLHGCIVKRNSLVGMNSVVMDGAVVGEESIVAAMCFVKAGFKGKSRQLLVGSPAKEIRQVTDQDMHWHGLNIREYQALAGRSAKSLKEVKPLSEAEKSRPRLAGITDVQPKM